MSEAVEEKEETRRRVHRGGSGPRRPYLPEYSEEAYEYSLAGHTDEEIAALLGIGTTLLYEWKRAHPEFAQAIAKGKAPADAKVVSALHRLATGDNVHAMQFWLKNRRPEQWRDRAEPAKIEIEFSFRRDPEVFGRTIEQFQDGKAHALIAQHPPLVQEHLRVVLENVPDERAQEVYDQALPAILAAAARGDSESPGREFAEVQQDVSEVQGGMANMDDPEEEEKATVQDAMEAVEVHNAKVRARALKKGKR